MNQNKQWKVLKIEHDGHATYSVFKSGKTLTVAGTNKFANAIPFFGGVAVAIEVRTKKGIAVEWHIANEKGNIVKSNQKFEDVVEFMRLVERGCPFEV